MVTTGNSIMGVGVYSTLATVSAVTRDLHWAVANLSCQQAQQDTVAYACVSPNSTCLSVNSSSTDTLDPGYMYIGYRCKCVDGFDGNPYIQNGCQGPPSHAYIYSFYWFSFSIL
jgi:hypothetical protein